MKDFKKIYDSFGDFQKKKAEEAIIKGSLDISSMEAAIQARLSDAKKDKEDILATRLEETLEPTLSAKELIEKIIRATLEVEFGHTFTLSKGFASMVGTIADSIITNPELRRQALRVASTYMGKKIRVSKEKSKKAGKNELKEEK